MMHIRACLRLLVWFFFCWFSRSKQHHSCRVPMLVDAQAVLGAAAKGRTSVCSIKRDVRKMAALTLASDMFAAYVYIPSEENPADAPSRGVVKKITKKQHAPATIKKLPKRQVPQKISNQMLGRPWWRKTDDPVADLLDRCSGEQRTLMQSLLADLGH